MDYIRFLNLEYFFSKTYAILTGTGDFAALGDTSLLTRISHLWTLYLPYIKIVSTYLSLITLTLFVYAYIRFKQTEAEEDKIFDNYYKPQEGEFATNDRWQRILALLNSENQSDWKQAIIEADVILDEIVTAQSYHGVTLGDKLKAVEISDFNTLNEAWEAHKVRNRIAHDGGDFILTEREARRVIGLYEKVFREFSFI